MTPTWEALRAVSASMICGNQPGLRYIYGPYIGVTVKTPHHWLDIEQLMTRAPQPFYGTPRATGMLVHNDLTKDGPGTKYTNKQSTSTR